MSQIIPTVFAHSKQEFCTRLKKLAHSTKNLQVDLMDGQFVKSKSIHISELPNLKKYKNNFEAHLMTLTPQKYIPSLQKKGFKKIIFHYESLPDKESICSTLTLIHDKKMAAWLAINPETPIEATIPFLNKVDGILLMGVHPGKEHQTFIPSVYKKISQLKKLSKKIKIQVDGGVNEQTISKLARSGVSIFNSGSYTADADDPKKAIQKLRELAK